MIRLALATRRSASARVPAGAYSSMTNTMSLARADPEIPSRAQLKCKSFSNGGVGSAICWLHQHCTCRAACWHSKPKPRNRFRRRAITRSASCDSHHWIFSRAKAPLAAYTQRCTSTSASRTITGGFNLIRSSTAAIIERTQPNQ